MKKITFSIMALALAAMTLTGCKKENAATQEPEKQAEKTAMTFYAVPQGGERTGLDGALNSVWTNGDQIKIFTVATIATGGDVFTLSKGAGTDYGEFTGESVEGDMYIGLYPASSFQYDDDYGFVLDMPGTQTYVENSYASNTVPLLAMSESKNLTFENLSGLLRVGIKVTSPTTVTSMVLKDKQSFARLWGKYQVQSVDMIRAIDGQGNTSITMDLGDGVALNSDTYTYFFFCMPAVPELMAALSQGFTIEMEDADGKTAIIDYTGTDKKVERGKGKTLEVDDVEFVTPAPPTRPACQSALDADANWVTIGTQKWLNVNTKCIEYDTESEAYTAGITTISTSSSKVHTPYYTDPTTESKPSYMSDEQFANLGMLYNWAAAVGLEDGQTQESAFTEKRQGICPNGSHVPSVAEWNTLRDYLGGASVACKKMKTSTGWQSGGATGEGDNGFAALPAGYAKGSSVYSVGSYTDYWSSDAYNSNSAYYRDLYYFNDYLNEKYTTKSSAYSVRCLRD